MNLADVMDDLATALGEIAELKVWSWPADTIVPPAAIVSYPEVYTLDATYARGMDRMTVPVVVVVGRLAAKNSRDILAGYCDGSGSRSVKAAIDGGTYTACDTATVTRVTFDTFTMNQIDYIAATFEVDVTGSGT